jgi:hypothetical protein
MRSKAAAVAKQDAALSKTRRRENVREADDSGDFIADPLQEDFMTGTPAHGTL